MPGQHLLAPVQVHEYTRHEWPVLHARCAHSELEFAAQMYPAALKLSDGQLALEPVQDSAWSQAP